jgi:uncharacterized DUF497 family protein
MAFGWDENRAAANLLKHGVSFDEAKLVPLLPGQL